MQRSDCVVVLNVPSGLMSRQRLGARASRPQLYRGFVTDGYLPHFDADEFVQMVTYRLADSLPAACRSPRRQRRTQE